MTTRIEDIRTEHVRRSDPDGDWCQSCCNDWPCDSKFLLSLVDELTIERDGAVERSRLLLSAKNAWMDKYHDHRRMTMTEPTTPTGKTLICDSCGARINRHDLARIEAEAAAMERERLESEGLHAPRPDCGPLKAMPHEHTYVWFSGGTMYEPPPIATPCIGCGHHYGDPEQDR